MIRTIRSCTAALLLACALPALALELDEAKALGLVGERLTGYLGVVEGGDEVQALVDEINAKRKAHYQRIAKENGIELEAVEKLAGEKAVNKTAAGHIVDIGDGWRTK